MWTLDPRCEISLHAAADAQAREQASGETALPILDDELGCGLQGPQSRAVREAGRRLRARLLGMDRAKALREAGALVDWLESLPEWKRISTRGVAGGRKRLRDSVLYPPRAPVPSPLLHVRQGTQGFDYPVPEGAWPRVADLFAGLSRGLSAVPRNSIAAEIHAELGAAGWLVPTPPRRPNVAQPGLCFVGHNTVRIATRRAAVLFDPWFRPWHDADPRGYRPLLPRDMGRVNAIFITHSHGDHFHLGSLVHFPRDTPVFVPRVEKDTLLAHDLRPFLRAAGFHRARSLGWGEQVRVGDLVVPRK